MILIGVCSKIGALFVTIPEPIIGGIFSVMFGIITAVGLSNLQFVDLNSTRNLLFLAFHFSFLLFCQSGWKLRRTRLASTQAMPPLTTSSLSFCQVACSLQWFLASSLT